MSSRLALDAHGRRVVEITMPQPRLEVGHRFLSLGNSARAGLTKETFYFLEGPTGRRAGRADRLPPRRWPASCRAEAHRLRDEGFSQRKIAELLCGDANYRTTVQTWLQSDPPTPQEPFSGVEAAW